MMAKIQISLSMRNTNKGSALKSKPLMPAIQFLPVNAMAQGSSYVLHIHPRLGRKSSNSMQKACFTRQKVTAQSLGEKPQSLGGKLSLSL